MKLNSWFVSTKIVLVLLFSCQGWSLGYQSEIFEQKSNFQKKLFDLKVESTTDQAGIVTATGTFKDSKSGEIAIQEVAKYREAELIETRLEQRQTGEKGFVTVSGDKIEFVYTNRDGKEKKNSEKIKPGMKILAPANFIVFIRKNWADLQSKKSIPLRFAVWDRAETVGFDLILEGAEKRSGQDLVKLKLKPSSFIIAALVNPIYLWFTPDGQRLMELSGRVAPKIKSDDAWKALDADVKYSYP